MKRLALGKSPQVKGGDALLNKVKVTVECRVTHLKTNLCAISVRGAPGVRQLGPEQGLTVYEGDCDLSTQCDVI